MRGIKVPWKGWELEEAAAPGFLFRASLSQRRVTVDLSNSLPPLYLSWGRQAGWSGTCSRRHLSTAHSTSQAALSLAYCCCSRSRARSSSRSSERKSSSKVFSALNSRWFSTTCGNMGVGSVTAGKGIL